MQLSSATSCCVSETCWSPAVTWSTSECPMPREREHTVADHVLEVVTPRTNTARLNAAEHLFSALALGTTRERDEGVALEISSDSERRRFLVRTTSSAMQSHAAGQLGAAYPQ